MGVKFKELIKSQIRSLIKEEFSEIDEMARPAKLIKIANEEKAQEVINKVKDTKKKWIADMIKKVMAAGDKGITQVDLAFALGKIDDEGKGRQQQINPEVRSLLAGEVFTFGDTLFKNKPQTQDTEEDDEIITTVPDEDEKDIEFQDDEIIDDEDTEEEEDNFYKADNEDEPEEEETLAKKAKPTNAVDKLNKELDNLMTQRSEVAQKYKEAKEKGNKWQETPLVADLKNLTNKIKAKERELKAILGDDEEDEDY